MDPFAPTSLYIIFSIGVVLFSILKPTTEEAYSRRFLLLCVAWVPLYFYFLLMICGLLFGVTEILHYHGSGHFAETVTLVISVLHTVSVFSFIAWTRLLDEREQGGQ